jgi:RNA methyltransferase, TrmH family
MPPESLRRHRRARPNESNEPTVITSADNQAVRLVRGLHRRKGRETTGLFLAEGERVVADAIEAGYQPNLVLVREGFTPGVPGIDALLEDRDVDTRVVAAPIFDTLADTVHPQGVLAAFPVPDAPAIPDGATLIVLLDGIRDPGNMGTLVRSAAGAGADALVIGAGSVDPWSPKVVRAAMGALLRLPIVPLDEAVTGRLLGLPLRAVADSVADEGYDAVDWSSPAVLVVGSEATGPSETGRAIGERPVRIPMAAGVESLNAGVAGSIILFEIARQRRTGPSHATTGPEPAIAGPAPAP